MQNFPCLLLHCPSVSLTVSLEEASSTAGFVRCPAMWLAAPPLHSPKANVSVAWCADPGAASPPKGGSLPRQTGKM